MLDNGGRDAHRIRFIATEYVSNPQDLPSKLT
jgi:hypothetical protein